MDEQTRLKAIEEMNRIWWWHSIEIPGLGVTPGHEPSPRSRDSYMGIPTNLIGIEVIDIGCWNGLYSFVAEERGASRVVAADLFEPRGTTLTGYGQPCGSIYPKREGIDFAAHYRRSKVQVENGDLMNMRPDTWGQYDLAFLFGVLYHLPNPVLGLSRLYDLVKPGGLAIIETALDTSPINGLRVVGADGGILPYMRFCEKEQDGDPTNWWYPSIPCVEAMCRSVGFEDTKYVGGSGPRGAFHARKPK